MTTAAIATGITPRDNKLSHPYRRNSASSIGSDGSSTPSETPISYAADPEHPEAPTPRTTKQKVDRRPPSTFVSRRWAPLFAESPSPTVLTPSGPFAVPQGHLADDARRADLQPRHVSARDARTQGRVARPRTASSPAGLAGEFVHRVARHRAAGTAPTGILGLPSCVPPSLLSPALPVVTDRCIVVSAEYKWPFALAYPFYILCFMGFALQVMDRLSSACVKHGTFDEKQIGRDRTPDKSVKHLAMGILAYMVVRTGIDFYINYEAEAQPLFDFTWTFPLRLAAWEITLDYFFYTYHRCAAPSISGT